MFNSLLSTQEQKTDAINQGAPAPLTKLVRESQDWEVWFDSCKSWIKQVCEMTAADSSVNSAVEIDFVAHCNLWSAQPSPTQKGGINAPFLNCTSEVTQQFLHINVTLVHKN